MQRITGLLTLNEMYILHAPPRLKRLCGRWGRKIVRAKGGRWFQANISRHNLEAAHMNSQKFVTPCTTHHMIKPDEVPARRRASEHKIPTLPKELLWHDPCAHILGQASTLSSWATQIELNEFKVEENTKLEEVGRWRWIWVGGVVYQNTLYQILNSKKLFK